MLRKLSALIRNKESVKNAAYIMDKSPFKTEPDGSVCLSAVALCKRLFCFHFQWKGTSQPHEKRKGETDMNDIMDLSPSERDELLL